MKKRLSVIAALALLLPAPSSAQTFGQERIANICNKDGDAILNYAIMDWDKGWGTKRVEGWHQIRPNQCMDVFRYSNQNTEHHIIFLGSGKQLNVTFGDRHREYFCADPKNGFQITENLFNGGRATKCQGGEVMMQANVRILGGYRIPFMEVPAWSNTNSSKDGKVCGLLFCF